MSEPHAMTASAVGAKLRRWQPTRAFRITMLAVLMVVLSGIVVLAAVRINNYMDNRKLGQSIEAVALPSEFKLTSKSWTPADFGDGVWVYEYAIDASQQSALALLKENFQKAGYSFETVEGVAAENSDRGIRVSIETHSVAPKQPGTKPADQAQLPPQKVTLTVEAK